jgi:hypothetical protein
MRLLEKSSQLAREYRTEVPVCPSGKSVDPKFLSSNGVLAHSRIAEEYASIRELIASVSTSAFLGTKPRGGLITSELPSSGRNRQSARTNRSDPLLIPGEGRGFGRNLWQLVGVEQPAAFDHAPYFFRVVDVLERISLQ